MYFVGCKNSNLNQINLFKLYKKTDSSRSNILFRRNRNQAFYKFRNILIPTVSTPDRLYVSKVSEINRLHTLICWFELDLHDW